MEERNPPVGEEWAVVDGSREVRRHDCLGLAAP
jgi:hypothetical protein